MKEVREITKRDYHPSKDANNSYTITCPFCGAKTQAQVRGYYARGRRCSNKECKALFKNDIAIK